MKQNLTIFAGGDVFNELDDDWAGFQHLSPLLRQADIVFGNAQPGRFRRCPQPGARDLDMRHARHAFAWIRRERGIMRQQFFETGAALIRAIRLDHR